jgi:hypothetical protein
LFDHRSVALLDPSGFLSVLLGAVSGKPKRHDQGTDEHALKNERDQRCGFRTERRKRVPRVKKMVVRYERTQDGGKKARPQAPEPGAESYGSAKQRGAEA